MITFNTNLYYFTNYHCPIKFSIKLPDLEKSGNCCLANKDTGEKCYNTRLPNSLYCKEHVTNRPYGLPE